MIIDIERALVVSRRKLLTLGGLEPEAKKADAAHVVYSFVLAHMFQEKVKAPREIWGAFNELGLGG